MLPTENQILWTAYPFAVASVARDSGLQRVLDEVLRRKKMTGRASEIIIGHITFVLLGAIPALLYTAHVLSFRACTLSRGDSPLG